MKLGSRTVYAPFLVLAPARRSVLISCQKTRRTMAPTATDSHNMVPPLLQISTPVRPPLATTSVASLLFAETCHPLHWVMRVAVHAPALLGTSTMRALAAQVRDYQLLLAALTQLECLPLTPLPALQLLRWTRVSTTPVQTGPRALTCHRLKTTTPRVACAPAVLGTST
jgi:hypothetical protein